MFIYDKVDEVPRTAIRISESPISSMNIAQTEKLKSCLKRKKDLEGAQQCHGCKEIPKKGILYHLRYNEDCSKLYTSQEIKEIEKENRKNSAKANRQKKQLKYLIKKSIPTKTFI